MSVPQSQPNAALASTLGCEIGSSQLLGLHLERDGSSLRLWNPATGARLPTMDEREAAMHDRAEAEKARADAAEAELARLRARLQPKANGNGAHP